MRATLWPGLIKALQYNLNRQQTRVRLFESGLRFVGQLDELKQEPMLAGAITGNRLPEAWSNERAAADFYDIKADVEALLGYAGDAVAYSFFAGEHPALHPGQTARIERKGAWSATSGAFIPNWPPRWASINRSIFSSCWLPRSAKGGCHASASCPASLRCGATWLSSGARGVG